MNAEDNIERALLSVSLEPASLSVSYVSGLLRELQVALREVALNTEGARREFEKRPQPMLLLWGPLGGGTDMRFVFVAENGSTPLEDLSARVFDAFLDRFMEYVGALPQPTLWGGAAPRPANKDFESEVTRRMDETYRELKRADKAVLRFGNRTIEIEGDRLEIV